MAPSSLRQLRLCFLAPGANVHTRRWVNAMVDRGHRVLLITTDVPEAIRAEVYNPFQHIGRWSRIPKVRVFFAERAILRTVRQFRPHLVPMPWRAAHLSTLRLAGRLDNLLISVWGRDVVWPFEAAEPTRLVHLKQRILAQARHI